MKLAYVVIFSLFAFSTAQEWNWADCDHGWFDYGTKTCYCSPYWEGVECNICSGLLSCGMNATCVTGFQPSTQKNFNCMIKPGGSPITLSAFSMGFIFDNNNVGSGSMDVYLQPSGPPFMFNCTFENCAQFSNGTHLIYKCAETNCTCNYCYPALVELIDSIHTTSMLSCEQSSGNCTFTQNELTFPFLMTCQASGCELPNPKCSSFGTCNQCASSGCEWCLESNTCVSSGNGACTSFITNAGYCPGCGGYNNCTTCSGNGCSWCIDTNSCMYRTYDPGFCGDVVNEPRSCPYVQVKKN